MRPSLLPRPNVALLTPPVERAFDRLEVEPHFAVLASAEALRGTIDQPRAHPTAEQLALLGEDFAELLGRVEAAIADIATDTGIAKASAKLRESTEGAFSRLRERVDAYLMTQDKARQAARQRVLDSMFPGGTPQERVVGIIAPLLANNGPDALQRIAEQIDLRAPGTQAVRLAGLDVTL
jgi:hypothetical protein